MSKSDVLWNEFDNEVETIRRLLAEMDQLALQRDKGGHCAPDHTAIPGRSRR